MRTLLTIVPGREIPGHVPTAPIGRRLADRPLAAGEPVRVLAPASEVGSWPGGVGVIAGDIARPAESEAAFRGIERMFLAGASPETVWEAVDLAKRGGVRRIVVLTSHGPEFEIQYPPEAWHWLAIEVVVERSTVEWTHIRPSAVMASTLMDGYPRTGSSWVEAIRNDRMIRDAHVHARVPFIDEDDLAAVAVAALLEDEYVGTTLNAYGEPISTVEQLQLIGEALGREIRFEELTPEQARDVFRSEGMAEEMIELSLSVGAEFLANPMDMEPTVERVLGRPPRSYAQWLADHVDAFR